MVYERNSRNNLRKPKKQVEEDVAVAMGCLVIVWILFLMGAITAGLVLLFMWLL